MSNFNPFSLENKIVLVTGASSGIGRQCAVDCSKMGARVVLLGRNQERLEETLTLMEGEGHLLVAFDLTESEKIKEVVAGVVSTVGPINGVLHCAGISETLPLKLMKTELLDKFFRNNVYSAIELTREVCSVRNISKDGASIVFFSSIMGCVGDSGKSLYSMTKGALIAATRSLACEYAKKRIRFNCVSPGAILTPINANLPHMADPEKKQALADKHLLGLGECCDISNACIYLLSDASKWVTGQNLIIDGGYTAR